MGLWESGCARVLFSLGLAAWCDPSICQAFTYTHTSSEDGFSWPSVLEDTFSETTNEGVEYLNYTGADTFFDAGYSHVGAFGQINGDAWWGSPDSGPVYLSFYNTLDEGVDSLSFDFAWAVEDDLASTTLTMEVYDIDFNSVFLDYDLTEGFVGASYAAAGGNVLLNAADLMYDDGEELIPLTNIAEVAIYVGDINAFGAYSEFAIDNVTIDADGGDPADSDLEASVAVSTRWLRNTFDPRVSVSVQNLGTGATTFTQSLEPSSDPEFQDLGPASNQPISANAEVFPPNVAMLSKDEISGEYLAQVRTANDLNPLDPDRVTPYTIWMYDPPVLTDNSASPIDVNAPDPGNNPPTLSIQNVAAGPHAGALRAGAEVTASTVTGAGFQVTGMGVGDFVEPGETELSVASFNRYGRLTGLYAGGFLVDLKMNSQAGSFLNGAQPISSVSWTLEYDLADTPSDAASIATGGAFDRQLGVNNATTAATLVGGQAAVAVDVTMAIAANPGPMAPPNLATELIDLQFSTSGDRYVLQFTYTDLGVPVGINEGDLELIYFNQSGNEWLTAVSGNSDAGAGAAMFAGSFEDYLSSLSGGPIALSAYGVDTLNNQAWAVLDHASIFGLGGVDALGPIPGDFNADRVVDAADYALWRNHLGEPNDDALNGAGDGEDGVGSGDYALWRSHFGIGQSSAAALEQAPEPTTAMLALAALGFSGCRRLPRRR